MDLLILSDFLEPVIFLISGPICSHNKMWCFYQLCNYFPPKSPHYYNYNDTHQLYYIITTISEILHHFPIVYRAGNLKREISSAYDPLFGYLKKPIIILHTMKKLFSKCGSGVFKVVKFPLYRH